MTFDRRRAAVAIAGFCAFLDLYAPQAVLPQLSEQFHISVAGAGGAVGISTLAVAVAAPFVGMLADRFGYKATIVSAALLLLVPTILLVRAASFDEILVWRFVQGLLLPAIFSPVVAFVSEEWPPGEAADVMGLYITGSALGGFAGRFVTALLAESLGWRAGFSVLALFTLASFVALWAWLPSAARRRAASAAPPGALAGVWGHLSNPVLLATCAVGFAVLFSMVATFTYVSFHLAGPPFSLSPAQLGMIFLVYPIGAAVTPASGFLIRRLGRRPAMALAISTSCVGLLAGLNSNVPVILAGLALYVSGVFTAQSAAMGFVGQAARQAKATAVGLYVCSYYVGGSVGAVLPGLIVWNRGGWAGCVALVLATMSGAGLLAWRAWRGEERICRAA